MAILAITRDTLNETLNIVRVLSSDSLATITASGYLTSQIAVIESLNNGLWSWQASDEVLISYNCTTNSQGVIVGGTNAFFQVSPSFASLVGNGSLFPVQGSLTAHAGGGQTSATQLNAGYNVVSVVATVADSVVLPVAVSGQLVSVTNTSANSLNVFPALGDTINALSANTALAVAAGATTIFIGASATAWYSK